MVDEKQKAAFEAQEEGNVLVKLERNSEKEDTASKELTLSGYDVFVLNRLIHRLQTDRVKCFQVLEEYGVKIQDAPGLLTLIKPGVNQVGGHNYA